MFDGLGQLGRIFSVEDLGFEEVLPVGFFLFVYGDRSAVNSVHNDEDNLAGDSHTGGEEDTFVPSVNI